MDKDVMKELIKLKLKLVDGIIERLPEDKSRKLHGKYHDFLSTFNNIVNEYIEKSTTPGSNQNVKPVNIE